MRQTVLLGLALVLSLLGCQPQEGGGGGPTPAGSPEAARRPGLELGEYYDDAYIHMAQAYMSTLEGDWRAAHRHAVQGQNSLNEVKRLAGRRLPRMVTRQIDTAGQLVEMTVTQHPSAPSTAKTMMLNLTANADEVMSKLGSLTEEGAAEPPQR